MTETAGSRTDDAPFECDACGRRFESPDALGRHLRDRGLVA